MSHQPFCVLVRMSNYLRGESQCIAKPLRRSLNFQSGEILIDEELKPISLNDSVYCSKWLRRFYYSSQVLNNWYRYCLTTRTHSLNYTHRALWCSPVTSRHRACLLSFFGGFIHEWLVNVRNDATPRNSGLDESIQFFITSDGKLKVSGSYAFHLSVILGSYIGVILACLLTFRSFDALPANSRTSAVRYSVWL